MQHFLEGIAPLRHWYINPNEKSNKYIPSLLSWLTKALMEHFLQGNVPLRHLLNAKPPFMSWQRSAFNEVYNWALKLHYQVCYNAKFHGPYSHIHLVIKYPVMLCVLFEVITLIIRKEGSYFLQKFVKKSTLLQARTNRSIFSCSQL